MVLGAVGADIVPALTAALLYTWAGAFGSDTVPWPTWRASAGSALATLSAMRCVRCVRSLAPDSAARSLTVCSPASLPDWALNVGLPTVSARPQSCALSTMTACCKSVERCD